MLKSSLFSHSLSQNIDLFANNSNVYNQKILYPIELLLNFRETNEQINLNDSELQPLNS